MKKLVLLVGILVAVLFNFTVTGAQEPTICSLNLKSQNDNQLVIEVHGTGSDWFDLYWPEGGSGAQDGWLVDINLSFSGGPHQVITMTPYQVSTVCAKLEVHVPKWDSSEPGGNDPGLPASAVSMPVSPGSKAHICRSITAVRNENRVEFIIIAEGEMPERPFTVYFGDGSYDRPLRNGGSVFTSHSYEMETLANGVTVRVVPDLMGDFGDCLIYAGFNTSMSGFEAVNR